VKTAAGFRTIQILIGNFKADINWNQRLQNVRPVDA